MDDALTELDIANDTRVTGTVVSPPYPWDNPVTPLTPVPAPSQPVVTPSYVFSSNSEVLGAINASRDAILDAIREAAEEETLWGEWVIVQEWSPVDNPQGPTIVATIGPDASVFEAMAQFDETVEARAETNPPRVEEYKLYELTDRAKVVPSGARVER